MRKVLLIALVLTAISAKGANWEKVTDRSTIQEGKVYFIVSYDKKYYYMMNEYSNRVIYAKKPEKLICDIDSYFSFQFKKADNSYWNLYNVYRGAFVNFETSTMEIKDKPNGKNATLWKFDNQYIYAQYSIEDWYTLSYNTKNNLYSLYAERTIDKDNKKDAKDRVMSIPDIYELTTFTLDETRDLPKLLSPVSIHNVIFKKTFTPNVNNTLLLPCDVPEYKKVFGEDVTAYQYTSIDEGSITFTEVTGSDLKANTPYIIKGTNFKPSPYSINATTVFPSHDDMTFHDNHITGSFKNTKMDKDGFIFTKNGTKKYSATNNSTLSPYKWYFTFAANNAKLNILDNNISEGNQITTEKAENLAIYNLMGIKVAENNDGKNSLKHGIYIQGRKKIRI